MILESLNDSFKMIKLTSFEELARQNTENFTAKDLLDQSNIELKQIAKALDILKMDEDDIRHDVFSIIYEMLLDNIELRVKQNKLNLRVLNQAQLSLDKTVHNY